MSLNPAVISVVPQARAHDPAVQLAPELTVVIPTFNERVNIEPMIERLRTALVDRNWEVIFVDDDSPDGTATAVRYVGENDRRVA